MSKNNDKIVERIYFKMRLSLESPLILGGGEAAYSDIDFLTDWNGNYFIPATSLAGAFRSHVRKILPSQYKNTAEVLFGKSEDDSALSLISIENSYFVDNKANIIKRDGIKLDYRTKTTIKGAKYDYQVADAGSEVELRFDVLFREKHSICINELKQILHLLVNELAEGRVSLGAKTRRGYGRIKLVEKSFQTAVFLFPEDANKWLEFTDKEYSAGSYEFLNSQNSQIAPKINHTVITADLDIPYSVLIKHYSSKPEEPDSEHIVSKGKSVIPGTSWNGALRHAVHKISSSLGLKEENVEEIFGGIKEGRNLPYKKRHKVSRLSINESVISGDKRINVRRTKIDRFTGGAAKSALFDAFVSYSGKTSLTLTFEKSEPWMIALVLLALKDICNGIQPVGGEASIGRGILKGSSIKVNNMELSEKDEERYFSELISFMEGTYGKQ